jgi:hypothetical protein
MATYDVDVVLSVYNSSDNTFIGSRSFYASNPHPATGKQVVGWKWDETWWPNPVQETTISGHVPSLWDANTSIYPDTYFQSGIGDNNDALLLEINKVEISGNDHYWSPVLQHGHFYTADDEWYLYSDDYITQYPSVTGIDNQGYPYLDLQENLKPTIPVTARRFYFDFNEGRHKVDLEARRKVDFSTTIPSGIVEYVLDEDFEPPRILFSSSGIYKEIGEDIVGGHQGNLIEILGYSSGDPLQEFKLVYSPVDRDADVKVWVWGGTDFDEYTVLPASGIFTAGNSKEAKVDYDTGTIYFGDYDEDELTGSGKIPPIGYTVGARYTATVAVMYEPDYARDTITLDDPTNNINPVRTGTAQGFIQLSSYINEAASIVLSSTLPQINPFLINLGNNTGLVYAQVRSTSGALLSGQEVQFRILAPEFGTFGGVLTDITAITDALGEARVFFNAPAIANDIGYATLAVEHSGSDTIVTVSGMSVPTDLTKLTLMKIHQSDEILGMPETDLAAYYTSYLADNNIAVDPNGDPASSTFETNWRNAFGLGTPLTYDSTELSVGKKTIVLTQKDNTGNVLDTHTGMYDDAPATSSGVWSPIYPSAMSDIGTTDYPILQLTYANTLLPLPGTEDTKAYFAMGDVTTYLQAYVVNRSTGRRISSNIIGMRVLIPSTLNGSFFATELSELPDGMLSKVRDVTAIAAGNINATSGINSFYSAYLSERFYYYNSSSYETYYDWFIRTRKADTASLMDAAEELSDPDITGLEPITATDVPSEVPLGFRLRSQGISIASVLDQVTFLDPNDTLVSGYYST